MSDKHEMTAREYHNIAKRMLKTDIRAFKLWWDMMRWLDLAGDKALAFAQNWAREHPEKSEKQCKTYIEDFLQYFPNVQLINGVPYLCRKQVYGGDKSNCDRMNCVACWNAEMNEEDDG